MPPLLALLPVLVPLLWLLILRRSALVAGGLGCLVALALVSLPTPYRTAWPELGWATLNGCLLTLLVVYILFSGLLLYHIMRLSGALDRLAHALADVAPNPTAQMTLLLLGLAPFVESVSGFGVGVVVAAPLFVALGFTPRQAALLGLLGLNCVPWGGLAVGTLLGGQLAGVSSASMGVGSALLTAPLLLYYGVLGAMITGGLNALRRIWSVMLMMAVTLSLSLWFTSQYISVELAGIVGGLAATLVGIGLIRRQPTSSHSPPVSLASPYARSSLLRAATPYLVLTTALLLTRLVPPLSATLRAVVRLDVPRLNYSLPVLYSPGFWLLMTCLIAIWVGRLKRGDVQQAFRSTLRQWRLAAASTAVFVTLSQWMAVSGMTTHLAQSLVALVGGGYLLAAPFIGGLGGFLTGSNASSNALFMGLQAAAARSLGLDLAPIAAAQNTGGAHLTMSTPSRVILAASVTDQPQAENSILGIILVINMGSLILMALTLSVWVYTQ